ncbi:hypothetical protein BCR44DRAFT_25911 [Catenaria anguillulae PL171]|uniref:Uncharacterized protein n=1 Tax=Catenaria anguillulae PL171 TaxID=765915 RepID=A0A1Y2HBM8_9FUNG|nr:hypothetical protein BCR44DRAFT_25911 [Catenaria anguillulae PL171]
MNATKSLTAFLALFLLALTASTLAAPSTPAHLDKRFVKSWIDRKIINPLVDNQVAPILRKQVDETVEKVKPELLNDVPKVFRQTLAEILGVAPIVDNEAKCGWLQPLCNAIIRPLDRIVDNVKTKAKVEVEKVLADSKVHCVNAALRSVKKQLFLDENSKKVLVKRGLKGWYHTKINHFMANVMTEIRPEIHIIVREMSQRYLSKLPNILQSAVNPFLPESLRTPLPQHINDRKAKRGIMDAIRNKIAEWQKAILARIHDVVEDVLVGLEEQIMETVRKTTRKAVADALPFFDEDDAKFKN